jgi:hypothetical protein
VFHRETAIRALYHASSVGCYGEDITRNKYGRCDVTNSTEVSVPVRMIFGYFRAEAAELVGNQEV